MVVNSVSDRVVTCRAMVVVIVVAFVRGVVIVVTQVKFILW